MKKHGRFKISFVWDGFKFAGRKFRKAFDKNDQPFSKRLVIKWVNN